MITLIYALIGIAAIALTIYFAFKSKEFLKFLSGAFFVSAGVQLYLFFAQVSIPVLGTTIVQTPQMAAIRCIPHAVLCVVCFYFGFIKKADKQK